MQNMIVLMTSYHNASNNILTIVNRDIKIVQFNLNETYTE